MLWIVGALLIVANWPYTLIVIMPVNHRLEALSPPISPEARALLVRWGRLHAARSGSARWRRWPSLPSSGVA
jgi:hypothetical protein